MNFRIVKLFLCFIILFGLICQMMASAALPPEGVFEKKSDNQDYISSGASCVAVDNFDQHTTNLVNTVSGTSYSKRSAGTDVFSVIPGQFYSKNNYHIMPLESGGTDKILELINKTAQHGGLHTLGFKVQSNFRYTLSYDFKFAKMSSSYTKEVHLGSYGTNGGGGRLIVQYNSIDGKYKMTAHGNSKDTLYPELNKWYTLYTTIDGSGNAKTYLLDKDTGERLLYGYDNNAVPVDTDTYFCAVYIASGGSTNGDVAIQINDTKLAVYDERLYSPGIIGSTIQESEYEISNALKSVGISFDQPIATAGTAEIVSSDGLVTVSCEVSEDETKLNSFTISWNENLAAAEGYTLKLSGFKNLSSASSDDTIVFKVTDTPKEPVSLTSITLSNGDKLENNAVGVSCNDSFIMCFDNSIIPPEVNTEVKLYKTEDTTALVDFTLNLTDDTKKLTLTPKNALSLSTSYTLDISGVLSSSYGTFIGDNSVIVFTTIGRDDLCEGETFDNLSAGTYTGDVFVAGSGLSVVPKAGYNGSACLKYSGGVLKTADSYNLDTSETIWFEYKFNIPAFTNVPVSTNIATVALFDNSKLYIYPSIISTDNMGKTKITNRISQSRDYYFKENTWYTIVAKQNKTNQQLYLYDQDGNLLVHCTSDTYAVSDVVFRPFRMLLSENFPEILIDDFKVYRTSTDRKLDFAQDSLVKNDSSDVVYDECISIAFNQPVNTDKVANGITLWNGSTQVDSIVKCSGGGIISIYPANKLFDGTTYTVKLSDVGSLSENTSAFTQFNFTTKKFYDIKITDSNLSITDGNIEAGEKTVFYSNSGETASVDVVAAVYSADGAGRLMGIEISENISLALGSSNVAMSFMNSYSNVGYVDFIIYDSISNFNSIAQSYRVK